MIKYLEEKDLDSLLRLTNQDVDKKLFMKKRLNSCYLILSLLVFWPLTYYSQSYLFLIIVLSFLGYKEKYLRLKSKKSKMIKKAKIQFPLWLRQLQILMQNNNIMQSIKRSSNNAPEMIKGHLEIFLKEIEKDPLAINPYLNFMNEYNLLEIQRAMKLIYRYNFLDLEQTYNQFERMILSTSKLIRKSRQLKYESNIMLSQWLAIIPLVGVTILFICILSQLIMIIL